MSLHLARGFCLSTPVQYWNRVLAHHQAVSKATDTTEAVGDNRRKEKNEPIKGVRERGKLIIMTLQLRQEQHQPHHPPQSKLSNREEKIMSQYHPQDLYHLCILLLRILLLLVRIIIVKDLLIWNQQNHNLRLLNVKYHNKNQFDLQIL